MKKISIFLVCAALSSAAVQAQTPTPPTQPSTQEQAPATAQDLVPAVKLGNNISAKFGGFVRAEYYIDNREIVGAVDDLFGFFPEAPLLDANGHDLNKVVRQNLSTQATRFNSLFTGPDFLGAKSSAFFEFDFSGGNTVNVRLRHAWAKLSWQKADVLIGKTWNPLAETPFPAVAGLHTGIPYRPFGRGDQIRVTYKPTEKLSVVAAGVFQTEHKTTLDPSQSADIRSNPIPDFHLQVHYKTPSFSAGALSEYKVVRPATYTSNAAGEKFSTDVTLPSYALGAYATYKKDLFNVIASAIYGQNLSELFQQGGYAVTEIDPATGAKEYSASTTSSYWIHATYGKTWVVGLFGGYQKNLGFSNNILAGGSNFFGRWQNIDHLYRISPSLKYVYKQWAFQAEVDYNVAAYGTVDYADKGKVKDAKETSGVRGILATTFYF
ncbi:MAG: hypothetical protein LBU90_05290 [Bacteroidales bacterium]|jgi:hypothetical protein|nr:hypothetical protein [Bacteroidales bacterium]